MATLTVGVGQEFASIAAAVQASAAGDTVAVQAGTYTNDFVTISHDLTLQAVGGTVDLVATAAPPDGKAYIDAGGSGTAVTIAGFDISGVAVPDGNGAAIRYEGGALTLVGDDLHDNQEGILGAADPNGTVTIDRSTIANNGAGDGYTHNIYIGAIAALTVENSTITAANVGHDIKSRAATTTIIGNTITDGPAGTASYEIDLPNGGNGTIEGNVIEKGPNAQNRIAISFGEEGNVPAGSSLHVSNNVILGDLPGVNTTAVRNATGVTASIDGNSLYGWTNVAAGPATLADNVMLAAEPPLTSLAPGSSGTSALTASGGSNDPVAISPSPQAPGLLDVYRFFDGSNGTQFLTTSLDEANGLLSTRPDMTYEGLAMTAIASAADDPNAVRVYRYFDSRLGTHFYTASQSEQATIAATRPDLILESDGFFEHAMPEPGDQPVYRFFETQTGDHFFTGSAAETATIQATRPDMTYEGVAFYAHPAG